MNEAIVKNMVDVLLQVTKGDNKIEAHLSFKNFSSRNVFLEKQTIYLGGRVRNNYFEITDEKGSEVIYLGMMASRVITSKDFVELSSGEEIKSKIVLSEYYKLEHGNKYLIRYFAYNPSYLSDQPLIEMASNIVEITY
jgi:hypothetical protein